MNKLRKIFKRTIGFYYCSSDWREAIVKEIKETYGNFIISCKEDSYSVTIDIVGDTIVKILDIDYECSRGYRFDEVYVEASLKSDVETMNKFVVPSIDNREKTIHFIDTEITTNFYVN